MFDFKEFSFLSDFISAQNGIACVSEDAIVRVCISRLYYSIFHQIGTKFNIETRKNVRAKHTDLQVHLQTYQKQFPVFALKNLYALRIIADYDDPQQVFTKNVQLALAKDYYQELAKHL